MRGAQGKQINMSKEIKRGQEYLRPYTLSPQKFKFS